MLLATRIAGRWRRLEAFCSVDVGNEELPLKPSVSVAMMNGEESLWGEEGASYKLNSLYQSFHCGKPQLNASIKQVGLYW